MNICIANIFFPLWRNKIQRYTLFAKKSRSLSAIFWIKKLNLWELEVGMEKRISSKERRWDRRKKRALLSLAACMCAEEARRWSSSSNGMWALLKKIGRFSKHVLLTEQSKAKLHELCHNTDLRTIQPHPYTLRVTRAIEIHILWIEIEGIISLCTTFIMTSQCPPKVHFGLSFVHITSLNISLDHRPRDLSWHSWSQLSVVAWYLQVTLFYSHCPSLTKSSKSATGKSYSLYTFPSAYFMCSATISKKKRK